MSGLRCAGVSGIKTCPDCAEDVRDSADVCRYCGHAFEHGRAWKRARNRRLVVLLLVGVVLVVGVWVLLARSVDHSERNACEDTREFLLDRGIEPTSDC